MVWLVWCIVLVLVLQPCRSQWTLISADNPPGQRFGSAATYCPGRDSMVMFSGFKYIQGLQEQYITLNDMWEYQFSQGQWNSLTQSGSVPAGRIWATLTYIPTNETTTDCTAVLIGGAMMGTGAPDVFITNGDVWLLKLSGGHTSWTKLVPLNVGPGTRSMHQAVYRRGSLILVGGHRFGAPSNLAFDDVWQMDLQNVSQLDATGNYSWNKLVPTSGGQTWIKPRFNHAMALFTGSDPASDRLVVFGGTTYSTDLDSAVLSDLCVYQFTTNQWYIPNGVQLERTAHGAIMANGRFFAFGGSTRVRVSTTAYRTYVFDDLLVTDMHPNPASDQGLSQAAPSCTGADGKVGLWCTAFDGKSDVRPMVRFNFVYVQRKDQFVVYGGSFKDLLGDFWIVNTTSALSTLVVSEADVLAGGSDLASTVYFMIAILSMMVVCFLVFVVSLRRHRNAHHVFIIGFAGGAQNQRPIGARRSIIEALPIRMYKKPQATSLATSGDAETSPGTLADPSATSSEQPADDLHSLCAICLTDYEDGENIRVLPCQHFFHPDCVDQWLLSHNACPMCKAVVDPEPEREEFLPPHDDVPPAAATEAETVNIEMQPTAETATVSPTHRDGEGRPTASV